MTLGMLASILFTLSYNDYELDCYSGHEQPEHCAELRNTIIRNGVFWVVEVWNMEEL